MIRRAPSLAPGIAAAAEAELRNRFLTFLVLAFTVTAALAFGVVPWVLLPPVVTRRPRRPRRPRPLARKVLAAALVAALVAGVLYDGDGRNARYESMIEGLLLSGGAEPTGAPRVKVRRGRRGAAGVSKHHLGAVGAPSAQERTNSRNFDGFSRGGE